MKTLNRNLLKQITTIHTLYNILVLQQNIHCYFFSIKAVSSSWGFQLKSIGLSANNNFCFPSPCNSQHELLYHKWKTVLCIGSYVTEYNSLLVWIGWWNIFDGHAYFTRVLCAYLGWTSFFEYGLCLGVSYNIESEISIEGEWVIYITSSNVASSLPLYIKLVNFVEICNFVIIDNHLNYVSTPFILIYFVFTMLKKCRFGSTYVW